MNDLLGAHMSIAGGLDQALRRGVGEGCDAVQIFTSNNMSWHTKIPTQHDVAKFVRARQETGIRSVIAHDSYLINLCSSRARVATRSLGALADELVRCAALELSALVMHPGAHLGQGEGRGLRRIADGLDEAIERADAGGVRILLETTAGSGTVLGHRFEQLAQIISMSHHADRLGVCFDTAHAFAAGYDLRTSEGCGRVFDEFDRVLGLDRLGCFHLNDSKVDLGSRVDRHEHIGRGKLGLEAFRFILNDPRLKDIPKILETPKGTYRRRSWDRRNLATLRSLIASKPVRRKERKR